MRWERIPADLDHATDPHEPGPPPPDAPVGSVVMAPAPDPLEGCMVRVVRDRSGCRHRKVHVHEVHDPVERVIHAMPEDDSFSPRQAVRGASLSDAILAALAQQRGEP